MYIRHGIALATLYYLNNSQHIIKVFCSINSQNMIYMHKYIWFVKIKSANEQQRAKLLEELRTKKLDLQSNIQISYFQTMFHYVAAAAIGRYYAACGGPQTSAGRKTLRRIATVHLL